MIKSPIIFSIIICLLYSGCSLKSVNTEVIKMAEPVYEIPTNCNFMNLVSSNNFDNECSPKISPSQTAKFEGIIINAPKEIVWPKNISISDYPVGLNGETSGPLRFMVTGVIQAKYMFLDLRGNFYRSILLVAVNQKTAQAYSGRIARGDINKLPHPPLSPEKQKEIDAYDEYHKNQLTEDYFTLDLVHDLGLPISEATYTVYATLGEYKSNELTINTKVR